MRKRSRGAIVREAGSREKEEKMMVLMCFRVNLRRKRGFW